MECGFSVGGVGKGSNFALVLDFLLHTPNPQHPKTNIPTVNLNSVECSNLIQVGCSTPERPTSKWIKGHIDGYMDKWDDQPIKDVKVSHFTLLFGSDNVLILW